MMKKSTVCMIAGILCFAIAAALYIITFVTGTMLDTKAVGAAGIVLMILFIALVFIGLRFKNIEDTEAKK